MMKRKEGPHLPGRDLSKWQRVLIVKPSSLGDIVHTLPVAHALKRCFSHITLGWLVQKSFAQLVHDDPCVDRVHEIHIPSTSEPGAGKGVWWQAGRAMFSAYRQLHEACSDEPYDLILDLHGSFRSGLLGRANPGGKRIGFAGARELNPWFQDETVPIAEGIHHALEKNLQFCHYLGCEPTSEDFFLHCRRRDLETARNFLDKHGISDKRGVIYGNPCARWQTKLWPVAHWAELADRCSDEGLIMVFGGSLLDRSYLEAIAQTMRTTAVIGAGELDLMQSAALLSQARAYIGLDSGFMHLAALAGVPVIALFGPTHPDRVGPFRVAHRIVRAEHLNCLECRKRQCASSACMREITVSMVFDAFCSLMAETDR